MLEKGKAYASADLLSSLSYVVPEHNDAAVRGDKCLIRIMQIYFVGGRQCIGNGKTKKPVELDCWRQ